LLEVFNSRGEMIYSHQRDEPEPEQIFSKSTVKQMNQMLVGVVQNGTGKRAQLDFTHAAGKTGTSSGYRDGWFMGYTGKLVTGVWVGRDDFRPVYRPGGRGLTGGSIPASIWQSYMAVAHKSMAFPTLAGLPDHPRQIEERQRLAALRRQNPAFGLEGDARKNAKLISAPTLRALTTLTRSLRAAAGIPDDGAEENPLAQIGRR
jgi:penicillin-binding protein 1A